MHFLGKEERIFLVLSNLQGKKVYYGENSSQHNQLWKYSRLSLYMGVADLSFFSDKSRVHE